MTLPLFTPMRSTADEILDEARAAIKQERAGMTAEQLMKLKRAIESARDSGDHEQVRELSRTHYGQTGAAGYR